MSSKQKHVVKFIDIVCGGTIDELVLESYAEKANVAEFVSKCLREHRFEKLRI